MLHPDVTCDGMAQNDMGECRMDIVKSEIGYLGYDATESYGITWKVNCTTKVVQVSIDLSVI